MIAVLTTIQTPTSAAVVLARAVASRGGRVLVIGDEKGPPHYNLDSTEFYPLSRQRELPFRLSSLLPARHYARKNLGYLLAIAQGASYIYETDDDTFPLENWKPRDEIVEGHGVSRSGWANAYTAFTAELIWPRGFPLELIRELGAKVHRSNLSTTRRSCWVQQGLINGSPDVDAVWRLTMDRPFEFEQSQSLIMDGGSWCPFNSQNTWWFPPAYPLLYLPSHCSFRMTDIWRSLIAQRCLWAAQSAVAFHAPDAQQDRNPHCLQKDFEDELPGYRYNARIAAMLGELPLDPSVTSMAGNLRACYVRLVSEDLLPPSELVLVDAWNLDCDRVRNSAMACERH